MGRREVAEQLLLRFPHFGVIAGEESGNRDAFLRKVLAVAEELERGPTHTVSELVERWRNEGWPVWRPSTQKAYARHAELISACIGDVVLADFTAKHAARVRAWVTEESGEAQAGLTCNTLKAIARYGVSVGWLVADPLRRFKRAQTRRLDRALTLEQMQRMDAALVREQNPHWPSPVACCRVILWTGERESLIRTLRREHVRLDFRSFELPSGKGKARARPIPGNLLPVLEAQMAFAGGELLFPGRNGDLAPVSDSSVRRYWERGLKAVGLEQGGMHIARHSVATLLANAGASAKELQELMGWESELMALRYTTVRPARLRALTRVAQGD